MNYQHVLDGSVYPYHLGKIICVGRNYLDHVRELGNSVSEEPVLFLKPASAAVPLTPGFALPSDEKLGKHYGCCHIETEMALLIGERLSGARVDDALKAVAGVGIGLDLTLRDLQNQLKAKGEPWEKAKAFDGSCPLSEFVSPGGLDWGQQGLTLTRNDQLQQTGNTSQMITPVAELLAYISRFFSLVPGDVVLTGTPSGVGPLASGDHLVASLEGLLTVAARVY